MAVEDDAKLTTEAAQKNWQDLSPEEMMTAMAAVATLEKIAEVLPTLTEEQKTSVKIQQEADKQRILKAGRRKADGLEAVEIFHESRQTANSGAVDLKAMMASPPKGYEERVWDPVTKQVLMRHGQIGSLAGPDKGGKTRIAVSLMNALLDPTGGTPFLRYYAVEPLKKNQVVVHIALEEDETDMFAAWGPYLREDTSKADRVIAISYSGVNVNMTAGEIREEISKDIFRQLLEREKRLGIELDIGAIIIDPLFAMAQGDYNKDPRLATEVFNNVLKAWCKDSLGAEVVLVLAHTSREGGRMGSEGSIYGSIGWASKMHFLWYVLKDQKQDDYRIFGANRGRADTYANPQRLYMLAEETGDPEEYWGQVEVRPEEGAEAMEERSSGKSQDQRKKVSKMMGLRIWLMDRMAHGAGTPGPWKHHELLDELRNEEALISGRGEDVPFAASGSSLSKVITALEADGYVTKSIDPVDPKIHLVTWRGSGGVDLTVPSRAEAHSATGAAAAPSGAPAEASVRVPSDPPAEALEDHRSTVAPPPPLGIE